MSSDTRGVVITAAFITAAATIGAALIATEPWGGDDSSSQSATATERQDTPDLGSLLVEPASVFLSRDSGPAGTSVNVSGEGFAAGERVVISFHIEQIGSTNANDAGSFSSVAVEIPASLAIFAPQQFDISASGQKSIKSARAPFTITG